MASVDERLESNRTRRERRESHGWARHAPAGQKRYESDTMPLDKFRLWLYTRNVVIIGWHHVPAEASPYDAGPFSRQPPQFPEIHRSAHRAGQGPIAPERPAERVEFARLPQPLAGHAGGSPLRGGGDGSGSPDTGASRTPQVCRTRGYISPGGNRGGRSGKGIIWTREDLDSKSVRRPEQSPEPTENNALMKN